MANICGFGSGHLNDGVCRCPVSSACRGQRSWTAASYKRYDLPFVREEQADIERSPALALQALNSSIALASVASSMIFLSCASPGPGKDRS